jgi:hypothetical protein
MASGGCKRPCQSLADFCEGAFMLLISGKRASVGAVSFARALLNIYVSRRCSAIATIHL